LIKDELHLDKKKDFKLSFINKLSEVAIRDIGLVYPEIKDRIQPTDILELRCKECIDTLKNQPPLLKDDYDNYNITYPIIMSEDHILIFVTSFVQTKNRAAGGYDLLFSFTRKDNQWTLDKKMTLGVY